MAIHRFTRLIDRGEPVPVEVTAPDPGGLLVDWLNEVLWVLEVRQAGLAAVGATFVLTARVLIANDEYAAARARLAAQCGEQAARLHALSPGSLPELPVLLAADQIRQYREVLDAVGELAPTLQTATTARVARGLVERFWEPVGSGVQPASETEFLSRYLFGDGDGRAAARKIDATIRELPGFAGIPLLEAWIDRAEGRGRESGALFSYSRSITPRNSAQ